MEQADGSRRRLVVIRAQVLDVEGLLAGRRVLERARDFAHLDDLGRGGAGDHDDDDAVPW